VRRRCILHSSNRKGAYHQHSLVAFIIADSSLPALIRNRRKHRKEKKAMPDLDRLQQLHQRTTDEIREQRNREMEDFVAAKRSAREAGDEKTERARREFEEIGLNLEAYDSFHSSMAEEDRRDREGVRRRLVEESEDSRKAIQERGQFFREVGLDAALSPQDVKILPPSYAEVFSSKDEQDELSGGT
jgi:hypothetical protein